MGEKRNDNADGRLMDEAEGCTGLGQCNARMPFCGGMLEREIGRNCVLGGRGGVWTGKQTAQDGGRRE